MSEKKDEATPKLVEVTLDKPHTHEGVDYTAGGKIKVNEAEQHWLLSAGVIKAASKEAQKA